MARSIKSKRGKLLRRVLRTRYAKKADDHLKKIVEKAKNNELEDVANLVYKPIPKRLRKFENKKNAEMETEDSEEKNNDVVKDEVKEEAEKVIPKSESRGKRKLRYYSGNVESLRDKHGSLPRWVSQRQVRKQFIGKKIKKEKAKYRRSLKLH